MCSYEHDHVPRFIAPILHHLYGISAPAVLFAALSLHLNLACSSIIPHPRQESCPGFYPFDIPGLRIRNQDIYEGAYEVNRAFEMHQLVRTRASRQHGIIVLADSFYQHLHRRASDLSLLLRLYSLMAAFNR